MPGMWKLPCKHHASYELWKHAAQKKEVLRVDIALSVSGLYQRDSITGAIYNVLVRTQKVR